MKYKRYSNLDGPLFTIDKNDILMVRYENGEKDVFEDDTQNHIGMKIYPGMKYRQYRRNYSTSFYVPDANDAYSPFWSGFASFFIPGLGQAICGEWGRGLGIAAANIGLYALMETGVIAGYGMDDPGVPYGITLASMVGVVALDIWSVCDAVKVAKIKNMYHQDIRAQRAAYDVKFEPYFTYTPTTVHGGYQPTTGLSLKVSF